MPGHLSVFVVIIFVIQAAGQPFPAENTLLPFQYLFDSNFQFMQNQAEPDKDFIESSFRFNQIYLEKTGNKTLNNIYSWQQKTHAQNTARVFGQTFIFDTKMDQTYKKIIVSSDDPAQYSFKHYELLFTTGPQTHLFNEKLLVAGHVGAIKSESDWALVYDLGFTYKIISGLNLGYTFTNDPVHWKFQARRNSTSAKITFTEEKQHHLWWTDFKYSFLQSSFYFQYTQLNNNVITKNNNWIAPDGKQYNIGLKTKITEMFYLDEIEAVYLDFYRKSSGNFYSDQLTFGKITNLEAQFRSIGIGAKKSIEQIQLGLGLAVGKADFSARGYMDTWPFTDAWIDLLGLRSYLNSFYDYDFYNSSFSFRHFYKTGSSISAKVQYEQLYPGGLARTWQPQFLVFGVKNLETNNLNLKRQDGLYLQFSLQHKFDTFWGIEYSFSQYIPVYAEKGKKSDADASGPRLNKHFVYGGGRHYLQFQVFL